MERVVSLWREEGLGLNSGASSETIAALEQRLGTRLPDDVRGYFALANGMEEGSMDSHALRFWSIEEILSETSSPSSGHSGDPRDTPFADFLICSSFVFLRRLGEAELGVWLEDQRLEFPSLESFFERYETDPESIGLLLAEP
jgi:hypothetical protein